MQFDWKRLFLDANGRIGRQDYWIGVGCVFAANLLLGWIPFLGLVVSIAAAYAAVCVGSKRLHDFGKTGWLMLVPFGVGFVCGIVGLVMGGMAILGAASHNGAAAAGAFAGMSLMLGVLSLAGLFNLAFLIWTGVTVGDAGENRYGPAPLAAVNTSPPATM
jgi:uncharacterized membrane protein YhaH (DUF805 family)